MKKCRDWSCSKCGSGWEEKVGTHKENEGTTVWYCFWCKEHTKFNWRIREVSDDEPELEPPSKFCPSCKQLIPAEEQFKKICHSCQSIQADMDAQDFGKWGKRKI